MVKAAEDEKKCSLLITVVVHNGLANRLLPLVSCLRLAKQTNRKLNIIWNGTPVRSCIRYDGPPCKYYDLFEKNETLIELEKEGKIDYIRNYDFEYWLNKDMVMDVSCSGNIHTNYGLYTIIGEKEREESPTCMRLCDKISQGGELVMDKICKELGDLLRGDLQPVKELQNEIAKMKSTKFVNKNMIGIHIRSTDGGFTGIKWEGMITKLIEESVKWCKKSESNGVFLATDNPKYYIEFASKLVTEQFVFYNPPMELCGTKSTNDDKFNNDKYNVLSALIEMYLLGECNKGIVGTAASTFSVCGMLIGTSQYEKSRHFLINGKEHIPTFLDEFFS